jgi:REP element-mobilizing transposase RayT
LPTEILKGYKFERSNILETAKQLGRELSANELRKLVQLYSDKIEQYLDGGHGTCALRNPACAQVVQSALRYFDGDRYNLHAWCVMPNHVHVVVEPLAANRLPKIVHSWKSFTAKQCKRILAQKQQGSAFWHPEYYDHLIRDPVDFENQVGYVLRNPDHAHLGNWPWVGRGSADLGSGE